MSDAAPNNEATAPAETAPAPEKKDPGRPRGSKSVHMTKGMWAAAEAMWESGEYELKDISAKFGGIRRESLSRHFSKRGITKGAKNIAAEVRGAAVEAIKDKVAERARETKEEGYQWQRYIGTQIMRALENARKNGLAYATALNDVRTLREAANGIKATLEDRWKILGLDKEDSIGDTLPVLKVQELTPEEVDALRNRTETETDADLKELRDAELDDTEEEMEEDIVDTDAAAPIAPHVAPMEGVDTEGEDDDEDD